jgi:hypothetical protein
LPEGVSLEEILAELVELRRMVAAQAERITELERRLARRFVELLTSTLVGCAMGEETSEETLVTRTFRA